MIVQPVEKSNNPYADWVQPSDPAPSTPQQPQNQYQPPSSPPPAYTQGSYSTQHNTTHQGHNHQVQAYQSQVPLGLEASQDRARYPSHQQDAPGGGYPYDQGRAGSSYALPQHTDSLRPYSQTLGSGSSSPSPSDEQRNLSLASFFGNTGPPPMWHRQPAVHFPYNQFPPMCLISHSNDLGKGFPEVPPPCQVNPHPFATHDIAEEDWRRFLADIKKAASLSGMQRIKSNVIPLVTGVGLISGFFMASAIEKKMKAKNRGAAGDIVDHWNHYFFGPRRMEAVLCQASERLSGRDGAAPLGDPSQRRMANDLRHRTSHCSSPSSSSEDSDDDWRHHHDHNHGHGSLLFDKRQRRAERREAKAQRRCEKRARKLERRARKRSGEHAEPYQIFIQPI